MKVSELTGALLDLWVARAEGLCCTVQPGVWGRACINELGRCSIVANKWDSARYFEPSKNWNQGGPIIEREQISVTFCYTGDWTGITHVKGKLIAPSADTPLAAAMRCFIASKFGDEVADEASAQATNDACANEHRTK